MHNYYYKKYCEECGETTTHHYWRGFPGSRWEPEEPAGEFCDECGGFIPAPDGPDPDAMMED